MGTRVFHKRFIAVGALVATLFAIPLMAEASHFRGAAMIPTVSASGLLTVTSTSFWRKTATTTITEGGPMTVSGAPNAVQQSIVIDQSDARFGKITQVHTTQLSGAGTFAIQTSSCCRVSGIANASESTWTMNSTIVWDGSTANTPINFNFSAVQPEVLRGTAYVGNLGAVAGNGGTLTYDQALNQNINSQPVGFTVDASTGALAISAADTAANYSDNPTANIGADVAFSGNIFNSDGSKVEFDWLFDGVDTSSNLAPTVNDVAITATLGDIVNFTFTGTDPEGQLLTWSNALVSFFGPAVPVLAPTWNAATQLFTWDTTGSSLGTYNALAQAADPLNLTDIGTLSIELVAGGGNPIPEPTTMLLFGSGMLGLAVWRRYSKKNT